MLADNDRQGVVRCAVDPLSGTHSYSRGSSLEGLFKRRPLSLTLSLHLASSVLFLATCGSSVGDIRSSVEL